MTTYGLVPRRHPTTRKWSQTYPDDLKRLLDRWFSIGAQVYLEDIYRISTTGFKALAHVQGELLYEATSARSFLQKLPKAVPHPLPAYLELVDASTWQSVVFKQIPKSVVGTKEKAKAYASLHLPGIELPNEHVIDAYCISCYGLMKTVAYLKNDKTKTKKHTTAKVRK